MKKAWRVFKKWFIPHEENDHKPHILRPGTIAVVCALAIAAEFVILSSFSLPVSKSPLLGEIVIGALTDGTNSARVANGLSSLQENPLLMQAAQEKVNDMVANNYFAHTSPAGLTPWHWFENVGYSFTYAGENLAVDFSDSQDVTNAWLNSPEHRANILNANFTQIGIAIATGTYEGQSVVFVAEEFGAPSLLMAAAGSGSVPISPSAASVSSVPALHEAVSAPKPIPATITESGLQTSSSEPISVAVKGASIVAAPPVVALATGTASGPAQTPVTAPTSQFTPRTNVVQQAIANPRTAINSFYLLIAIIFAFALLLNVFVKIRIQHPNVIMGGVVAVSLASIFIILNQHILLSAVIK